MPGKRWAFSFNTEEGHTMRDYELYLFHADIIFPLYLHFSRRR